MKYNPISADTLFHYTSSLSVLESILTNEFYPRYCLEDHSMFDSEKNPVPHLSERAIPMVCFCDIPLSNVRSHVSNYGHYAIGLTKDWGKANGISPVFYTYKNAITASHLRGSYHESLGKIICNDTITTVPNDFIAAYLELLLYMTKPYEGRLIRNDKVIEDIRFYDEREWRYVPPLSSILQYKFKPSLSKEEFDSPETREENNIQLSAFRLGFAPKDIKYIILHNEAEIKEFIPNLRGIKAKYSPEEIDLLTTKIITMDQVMNDF